MADLPYDNPVKSLGLRSFVISTLAATAAGVLMSLLGYWVFHDHAGAMMLGMFVLLPMLIGFVAGLVADRFSAMMVSATHAPLLSYGILWLLGFEGIICVMMAYPITVVLAVLGGLLGAVVQNQIVSKVPKGSRLPFVLGLMTICPFLAGAVNHFEQPFREAKAYETFASQVDLPVGIDDAWRVLAELDGLDGPQPLLVRMGLPLPQRCELEYEGPGARRICHFNQGRIDQTVRVWQPPFRMEIDVDGSTLPGRAWLGFDSAAYRLEVIDDQTTRLTRTTTITTRLGPRWYWRPLERWGVTSEHQYVLDNLKRQAMQIAQQ